MEIRFPKSQISSWCNPPSSSLVPPSPPLSPSRTPSHSKWTHNCRSSGETVTNCRESSIYDLSSDQPFGHLFRRKILDILGADLKKNQRKVLALDALHYFTISRPELAAFYDHCTSFNTAVYGRCISPTLNCSLLLHWVCHKIIWSDFFIKVTRWHGNGKSMELGGFSSSLVDIISSQGVWGAKLHLPTVLGFRRGQR